MSIIDLIRSDDWPEAVPPQMICSPDDEAGKINRGRGIINLIVGRHIKDRKFLDFGCGEGHAVKFASELASRSVGYDVIKKGNLWGANENYLLTVDYEEVKSEAPYDVILLYDVLDHVSADVASRIFQQVYELCDENGMVFVRFHPWCSRHGGHYYQKLNKAYAHIVLTDEEAVELELFPFEGQKVIHPMATYSDLWDKAGFKSINQNVFKTRVESFFNAEEIKEIVIPAWEKSLNKNIANGITYPPPPMSIEFVDVSLKHK